MPQLSIYFEGDVNTGSWNIALGGMVTPVPGTPDAGEATLRGLATAMGESSEEATAYGAANIGGSTNLWQSTFLTSNGIDLSGEEIWDATEEGFTSVLDGLESAGAALLEAFM